ncbi:MAG: hypothetical protein AAFO29_11575 [Actinomycetota bacterium]
MSDPIPFGRDHEVDAALASLTAVGEREQQLLSADTMAGIARAAAAERTVAVAGPGTGPDPLIEVEPVAAPGATGLAPRPIRGRSALGLVAALLAIGGIGAAILAAVPEPVVTQDGASAGQAPATDDGAPEAERPVLDLGGLASSTTADPARTDDPEQADTPQVSAGETVGSTTTTPAPSTAPQTTAAPASTTGPVTSAPPSTAAPATPTSDPSVGSGPSTGDQLAIEVGMAATVRLTIADNRPQLDRIDLAPGWFVETTEPRPGALGRRFSDDDSIASLEIWSEPGWFRLGVDHGDWWPSSTEWTRTITIDQAGTVEVAYGDHGLSGLEILLGGGWEHHVDTVGPDHLQVVLEGPTPLYDRDIRVDAGRTTVDIVITGP